MESAGKIKAAIPHSNVQRESCHGSIRQYAVDHDVRKEAIGKFGAEHVSFHTEYPLKPKKKLPAFEKETPEALIRSV